METEENNLEPSQKDSDWEYSTKLQQKYPSIKDLRAAAEFTPDPDPVNHYGKHRMVKKMKSGQSLHYI